jgi:hypothetical protein
MSAVIDQDVDLLWDLEVELNYARNGARPLSWGYDLPAAVSRNGRAVDARRVRIHDARRALGLGLDRSGFELIRHQSTLGDWSAFRDAALVQAIEYPEVAAALEARTRASKVLIFDHTLRESSAVPGSVALGEPVRRVHNDETAASARNRVTRHLLADQAAWGLQRRFAILKFWRPIGGRVRQAPLALCDARTMGPGDLIPGDAAYQDGTAETVAFAYSPRHRWYWYPQQSPAEATLLKIYDSATDGRARLTAHTAFDDPSEPHDAPPRRSIELRALVFW